MPRWMAILVGVVLVSGLPTAALPSVGVTPGRSEVYDAVVSKAVESDMFRMVVLAGLEGSGHHYLVGTAHAMFEANPDLPQVDMDDFPDQDIRSQNPYFLRYFMRGNASLYVSAEDQAREDMSNLAAQAAGLVSPGTIYVHHTRSFPALSGPNKALQYVDLPRMAEMAEVSGVDMRVLYLRRSAREMIIANTVHRYFHK